MTEPRKYDTICKKKKRGHVCVLNDGHKSDTHQCFCNECWEEVKT